MILFARWCELQSRVYWATDPFGPYVETREGSAALERMWGPTLLSPEDTPSQGTRDWPRISVDLRTRVRSASIMEHLATGRCSEELFSQGPGPGLLLSGPLGTVRTFSPHCAGTEGEFWPGTPEAGWFRDLTLVCSSPRQAGDTRGPGRKRGLQLCSVVVTLFLGEEEAEIQGISKWKLEAAATHSQGFLLSDLILSH